MNIKFKLIEKDIEFDDLIFEENNICDNYELSFVIKTEKCKIDIFKVNLYFKNSILYIDTELGLKESVSKFNERIKKFMDGLVYGTEASLNFYGDNNINFLGFKTKNNIVITEKIGETDDNISIIRYILSGSKLYKDESFIMDLEKLISKLNLLF